MMPYAMRMGMLTPSSNTILVAVSVGLGMIPSVAPNFIQHLPKALPSLSHSGILLAAIASVLLNLYFNGLKLAAEAEREAAEGGSTSDVVSAMLKQGPRSRKAFSFLKSDNV